MGLQKHLSHKFTMSAALLIGRNIRSLSQQSHLSRKVKKNNLSARGAGVSTSSTRGLSWPVSWGRPKSLGLSFFRIKVVQFWDVYGHFTVFYHFSGKSIQDLGAGYGVHGGEQPLSDRSYRSTWWVSADLRTRKAQKTIEQIFNAFCHFFPPFWSLAALKSEWQLWPVRLFCPLLSLKFSQWKMIQRMLMRLFHVPSIAS